MDANGTRFHLLLGYEDWAGCTPALASQNGSSGTFDEVWKSQPAGGDGADLYWDPSRFEVTLRPRVFQFPTTPRDRRPDIRDRRGSARDRFGNWYWIAENGTEIHITSIGTGLTTRFWPDDAKTAREPCGERSDFAPREAKIVSAPLRLRGLAITEDHYLVVGTLEPAGLLVFDLHAGGPPHILSWPTSVPFSPLDMAAMPSGGVCILDRDLEMANRESRYWILDRHFQVVDQDGGGTGPEHELHEDFESTTSDDRHSHCRSPRAGISLGSSSPTELSDAVAIEALPDGSVLILDRREDEGFSQIVRYRFGKRFGDPASMDVMRKLIEPVHLAGFTLVAHDFAFVRHHEGNGDRKADQVYVVERQGNQTFAFEISFDAEQFKLSPQAAYLPMRLFTGKGLVAAGGEAFYDSGDRWLPLTEQRRPRFVSTANFFAPSDTPGPPESPAVAANQRRAFDGREPNCVWHRLMIDACIPREADIRIWSRAANDGASLTTALWHPQPALHRRGDGSELPFVKRPAAKDGGTWELLLQNTCGRYLQLRVQLQGNGRNTPRLRALRVYYPRFSYLKQYLPAVYREDNVSASFLERFLANPEGFLTAIEDKIAAVQLLFDVRSVPADMLDWLGGWLALVFDPSWDERRRRLLIQHAMDFFAYRGTLHGLQMALRLALDLCPDDSIFAPPSQTARPYAIRIIERFRTRRTPGLLADEATDDPGLRRTVAGRRWRPDQGRAELHRLYAAFLQSQQSTASPLVEFPLNPPAADQAAWKQFARATLGFIPSATASDLEAWQSFLARRYPNPDAFRAAYPAINGTTSQLPLPTQVPQDGAPLRDWYQFESVVLAMKRDAHQFTVLLPTAKGGLNAVFEQQQLKQWVQRIIELEKPAHTRFDVKFYWQYFRVGEVRLGENTVLDRGSRAPELSPPLVLGQSYLAESFLSAGHPNNVQDRFVVGRDPLRSTRSSNRNEQS